MSMAQDQPEQEAEIIVIEVANTERKNNASLGQGLECEGTWFLTID